MEAAVAAMRALGATEVVGALGPCIHAECYEFSADDLDAVADRLRRRRPGPTADGRPALDLPAAVAAALDAGGARRSTGSTAARRAADGYFSHRARRRPRTPGPVGVVGPRGVDGAGPVTTGGGPSPPGSSERLAAVRARIGPARPIRTR